MHTVPGLTRYLCEWSRSRMINRVDKTAGHQSLAAAAAAAADIASCLCLCLISPVNREEM